MRRWLREEAANETIRTGLRVTEADIIRRAVEKFMATRKHRGEGKVR